MIVSVFFVLFRPVDVTMFAILYSRIGIDHCVKDCLFTIVVVAATTTAAVPTFRSLQCNSH